jgi:hypothetical protein
MAAEPAVTLCVCVCGRCPFNTQFYWQLLYLGGRSLKRFCVIPLLLAPPSVLSSSNFYYLWGGGRNCNKSKLHSWTKQRKIKIRGNANCSESAAFPSVYKQMKIYRTIIIAFVCYLCETWYFIGKSCEDLRNLCPSSNIIRAIELRETKLTGPMWHAWQKWELRTKC